MDALGTSVASYTQSVLVSRASESPLALHHAMSPQALFRDSGIIKDADDLVLYLSWLMNLATWVPLPCGEASTSSVHSN